MAGFSNMPFRLLCLKHGAGMVFSEMISADALALGKGSALPNVKTCSQDAPVAFQLFGSKPEKFVKAVEYLESLPKPPELIDLNFGCPVDKVTSTCAGAMLLRYPSKMKAIVKAIKNASSTPLCAKIRLGWSRNNAVEIAAELESAGLDFLSVHARTVKQGYSGKADWNALGKVVDAVSIPVFGNGDVRKPEDAQALLELGCKAVLIGRAALANPLIFQQYKDFHKKRKYVQASPEEKRHVFNELVHLYETHGFDLFPCLKMQAMQLANGLENAKRLREKIAKTKKKDELAAVFNP